MGRGEIAGSRVENGPLREEGRGLRELDDAMPAVMMVLLSGSTDLSHIVVGLETLSLEVGVH